MALQIIVSCGVFMTIMFAVIGAESDVSDHIKEIQKQLRQVVKINEHLLSSIQELTVKYGSLENRYKGLVKTIRDVKDENDELKKRNLALEKEYRNFVEEHREAVDKNKSSDNANSNLKVMRRLLLPGAITVPPTIDRVAFFVRVNAGVSNLGDNQIIPMKMIVVDTANAFHGDIGTFVAPRDGLYAFFATITSYKGQLDYRIMKNGVQVAFGVSENEANKWASSSLSVLIQLTVGDHVYLQIHGNGHAVGEMIGSFSHFMGFSLI